MTTMQWGTRQQRKMLAQAKAADMGVKLRDYWLTSPFYCGPKPKVRTHRTRPGKYMPHQGAKQRARYLKQSQRSL